MKPRLCLVVLILALAGCYNVEQSQIERGFRWIARGQTERALATFEHVIQKNPESVLAFTGRGDAYFFSKNDLEAIEAYTRALVLQNQNPVQSEKEGDQETVGYRLLSYQNQGLSFPFGLTAFLHVRRGVAYHALAVGSDFAQRRDLFVAAEADLTQALEIAPGYQYAIDQRKLLMEEMNKEPIKPPQPTSVSAER